VTSKERMERRPKSSSGASTLQTEELTLESPNTPKSMKKFQKEKVVVEKDPKEEEILSIEVLEGQEKAAKKRKKKDVDVENSRPSKKAKKDSNKGKPSFISFSYFIVFYSLTLSALFSVWLTFLLEKEKEEAPVISIDFGLGDDKKASDPNGFSLFGGDDDGFDDVVWEGEFLSDL